MFFRQDVAINFKIDHENDQFNASISANLNSKRAWHDHLKMDFSKKKSSSQKIPMVINQFSVFFEATETYIHIYIWTSTS